MELIIDTSNEEMKVILVNNNDYVINKEIGVKHLEHLLPEIDRLLNENGKMLSDIKVFSVVVGPGSFTGIRIGVATVKAFCSVFAKSKIIAINMLDLLKDVILKANVAIKNNFTIIIKSTATKYYVGLYGKDGESLEQKVCDGEKIEEYLKEGCEVYSYNFEKTFGVFKTKKIILMPGNYISFVEKAKSEKNFTKLKDLKPIYLAMSQAEEEILKKEKTI